MMKSHFDGPTPSDLIRLAVCTDSHGIRWVCPAAGRWSEEFDDVDSAWVWRRRVGDAKLLPHPIPAGATWADYAAVLADPATRSTHRLVRYVDAVQVREAIAEYTERRLADGESLRQRATRLLGSPCAWASSTDLGKDLYRMDCVKRTVHVAGREWMERGTAAVIRLLEVSRGAPFSERRLRPIRQHDQ